MIKPGNLLFLQEEIRIMRIISTTRNSYIFLALILLILFLPQCAEEESPIPPGIAWTGTDPTSIPIRQRLLQAERGNLVRNPSFELGRIVNVDSNTVSHNITGWKEMGENISWLFHSPDFVDIGNQVRSGSRAIKINRNPGTEVSSQGDGIVSDFIRVIPGNYEFSFWIRLENIKPGSEFRGRRLDGAIDIRLLFFDKNRLPISGNTYDNSGNATLDQSIKSLMFSDFWQIDSFGWTPVKGRTTNDFLTEGDIPDEAKFVKLYLGLTGTGTMWIDDVDFRYTQRNFTSLERSKRMFDTTWSKLDMLIPTPQQARQLDPLQYHIRGTDSIPPPVIVIPSRPSRQTLNAAGLVQAKLDELFEKHYGKDSLQSVRIISTPAGKEIESGALVFSIGTDRHSDMLLPPDAAKDLGPQGYTIIPDSLYPNLIYLTGVTGVGDYYAAATAVQLLDDSLFIYHQAIITDYPDIEQRAFLVSPVAEASNTMDYSPFLSDMAELKLNWAYLDYYRSRTLWRQESRAYLDGLKIIGSESKATGMLKLAQMVHPYAFLSENLVLDSLNMDIRERWAFADSESRVKLLNYCNAGIGAGISTLVLCIHDHLPITSDGIYVIPSVRDQEKYINLQAAHSDMLRTLDSWRYRMNKKIDLEFVSPWYSNEDLVLSRGQAEQYFNDLNRKLPDNLRILWSGPARYSNDISAVDYYRFQHNLAGREFVLMDNSMNKVPEILMDTALLKHHPLKLRTLSIFHPYNVSFSEPGTFPGKHGKMLIYSSVSTEIMKIRIATAADFMWNPGKYDPDLSIWKILVSRYGRTATHELCRFSDAYYTSMASMIELKLVIDKQRLVKLIRDQEEIMKESLEELDRLLSSEEKLLNELKNLKKSLEDLYETDVKEIANQIITASESM